MNTRVITPERYAVLKHFVSKVANITDQAKAESLDVSVKTIQRVRKTRNYQEYRQLIARSYYPQAKPLIKVTSSKNHDIDKIVLIYLLLAAGFVTLLVYAFII